MKKRNGFTLIELLLVLAILGIIASIAVPAFVQWRQKRALKRAAERAVAVQVHR